MVQVAVEVRVIAHGCNIRFSLSDVSKMTRVPMSGNMLMGRSSIDLSDNLVLEIGTLPISEISPPAKLSLCEHTHFYGACFFAAVAGGGWWWLLGGLFCRVVGGGDGGVTVMMVESLDSNG